MTDTAAAAVVHRPRGQRFEHLDMLRGVAALLVLLGHVRGFVLIDHADLTAHKLVLTPLYMMLGLGHQAVVLFFALSGFLVGGRALREIARGTWTATEYALHRFARLWTALIPALIATALLDWIGRDILGLAGYRGEYWSVLSSGPGAGYSADTSLTTLLGNIAFLQTILVPVFGTNGPLWSLAYEFWYYFFIPFAWLAVAGRERSGIIRIAAALFAVAATVFLPFDILVMGSIWIAGALAWLIGDRVRAMSPRRAGLLFAGLALVSLAALAISFARPGLPIDLLLGLCLASLLPFIARLRNPGGYYARLTFWTSEISFTLYVVHFPLVAVLWFAWLAPVQFAPSIAAAACFTALAAAAIAYATAMWWLFERNTPRVRRAMSRALRRN